jgi:hypothetical protein
VVTFSVTTSLNPYYLGALSPPVAALVGTGIVLGCQHRAWLVVAGAMLVTAGYAFWLLPSAGTGLPSWLKPALVVVTVLALGLLCTRFAAGAAGGAIEIGAAAVAVALVPAVASASVVTSGLGPFQTPFESQRTTADTIAFFGAGFQAAQALPALEAGNAGIPYLMATQTSALAAPFIWASGREVLPVGGFTGTIPEPSLATLQSLIQLNDVRTFIQSPGTTDPRLVWVATHCTAVTSRTGNGPLLPVAVYYCLGSDTPVP